MASIGSISVSITANATRFTQTLNSIVPKLNTINKSVSSFSKDFSNNLNKIVPSIVSLKSQLREVYKIKKGGKYQLLPKSFTQNIRENLELIKQLRENIEAISKSVGKNSALGMSSRQLVKTAAAGQQPQVQPKWQIGPNATKERFQEFTKQVDAHEKSQQKLIGTNYKSTAAMKELKDGSISASFGIRKLDESFLHMMKRMLSLKQFTAKIVHYLTFTIGVQMVMRIRQGFQDLIQTFSDFEKAITDAVAISGYLGSGFEEARQSLSELSRDLSEKTVYSANEVASAFYDLASAGYDVTQMTEDELIPILEYAAATQSDLKEATQAVMATMKAFRMDLEDTGEIVDTFTAAITSSFLTMDKLRNAMKYVGPIAGTLGVSLQETVAAVSALTNVGMEGSQAGQRLNMVFTKLLKPTDRAKEMLEGMGLTMEELDPNVYSLTEILYKLQAAGFGAAEAAQMFRARTAGAAVVLVEQADSIAQAAANYKLAENMTHRVAEAQKDTLWASMKMTSDQFGELATVVGQQLAPAIQSLYQLLYDVVSPMISAFGGAIEFVTDHGDAFAVLLKILIPLLLALKVRSILAAKSIVLLGNSAMFSALKIKLMNAAIYLYGIACDVAIGIAGLFKKALVAIELAMINSSTAAGFLTGAVSLLSKAIKIAMGPIGWIALAIGAMVLTYHLFAGSVDKSRMAIESLNTTLKYQKGLLNETSDVLAHFIILNEEGVYDSKASWQNYIMSIVAAREQTGTLFDGVKKLFGMDTKKIELFGSDENYKRSMDVLMDITGKGKQEIEDALDALEHRIVTLKMSPEDALSGDEFEWLREALKDNMDLANSTLELADAQRKLSSEFIYYNDSLEKLQTSTKELSEVEEELNKVLEEEPNNLKKIMVLNDKYIKLREKTAEAENNWLGSINKIIVGIRAVDDTSTEANLDEWVGVVEDATKAQSDLNLKEERASELMEEQENATIELSRAIATYGNNSSEAASAQARLNDIIKQRATLMTDISSITGEIASRQSALNMILGEAALAEGKISKVEQDLLRDAMDLIDMRTEYIELSAKIMKLEAQQEALNYSREEHFKVMEEKLRNYLEKQLKIFEIEEKLYKLREQEDEQLEGLFQTLAEQGQLSDDMIDGYAAIQIAQGEILKLNKKFTETLDDLTPAQRELVEAFMDTVAGTEEYDKALSELEGAGLSGSQISIIKQYNDAQDDLTKATEDYRSSIIPVVASMEEMGAISSETASSYYDIIDNASEAALANYDLLASQRDMSDTMDGLIRTTTMLAKSLMGYGDNAEDLVGIYPQLLKKMGIEEDALTLLNGMYGTTSSSLSDFSDEQLIVAATLGEIAKQIGVYESGISGESIAKKLGMGDKDAAGFLDTLTNAATVSLDSIDSFKEIADALSDVKTEFDELNDSLSRLVDLLTVFASTTDAGMFDLAMRFDFPDMIGAYDNNLNEFLKMTEDRDMSFNMGISESWENEDWDAFFKSLDKDKRKDLEKVFEDYNFSTKFLSTWDGDEFDKWYDELSSSKRSDLNSVLDRFLYDVQVKSTWDGIDYEQWYSSLSATKKGQVNSAVQAMGGELNNETRWDNADWQSFLTDLESQKAADLQSTLLSLGLELPITIQYIEGKGGPPAQTKTKRKPKSSPKKDFYKAMGDPRGDDEIDIRDFIPGLTLPFAKGGLVKKPTLSMIGEEGREAIIPLEGRNKERGKSLLNKIIPEFYPDFSYLAEGGIFGGGDSRKDKRIDFSIFGKLKDLSSIYRILVEIKLGIFKYSTLILEVLRSKLKNILMDKPRYSKEFYPTDPIEIPIKPIKPIRIPILPPEFIDKPIGGTPGFNGEDDKLVFPMKDLKETINKLKDGIVKLYKQFELFRVKFVREGLGEEVDRRRTPGHYQRGTIAKEATLGVFGEAGAEALVPLEGKNRKHGREILETILPKYFPDMAFQRGGIFSVRSGSGDRDSQSIRVTIEGAGLEQTINALRDLFSSISSSLSSIKTYFNEASSDFSSKIKDSGSDLNTNISESINTLKEQFLGLKDTFVEIKDSLLLVVYELYDGTNRIASIIAASSINFDTSIKNAVQLLESSFKSLPRTLASEIVNEIVTRLKVGLQGIWDGLKSYIASKFGFQSGAIVSGPQMAMIGENGSEAVVPLEGKNKKQGAKILEYILPRFFPDIKMMQSGGIVGGGLNFGNIPALITSEVSAEEAEESLNRGASTILNNIQIGGRDAKLNFMQGALELFRKSQAAGDNIINASSEFGDSIIKGSVDFNESIKSALEREGEIWFRGGEKGENIGKLSKEKTTFWKPGSSSDPDRLKQIAEKYPEQAEAVQAMLDRGLARGGIVTRPTPGVFGEDGAEALIPLENNKKQGRDILLSILTNYYKDLIDFSSLNPIESVGTPKKPRMPKLPEFPRFEPIKEPKIFDDSIVKHLIKISNTLISIHKTLSMSKDGAYRNPINMPVPKYAKGGVAERASLGIFGESGDEAIVPLEGVNKKFGRDILNSIIPEYYPEMMGSDESPTMFGDVYNRELTKTTGDTSNENFNIYGPISVVNPENSMDFLNDMKLRARASRR